MQEAKKERGKERGRKKLGATKKAFTTKGAQRTRRVEQGLEAMR
jgi:hypothetical protein